MKEIVRVKERFQITIPRKIREKLKIGVGDVVEIAIRNGKLIISPKKLIDPDQAYFWTKGWQEGEKEAEEDIKAGRVKVFEKINDLVKDLDT
jgi:antitoxin MazE